MMIFHKIKHNIPALLLGFIIYCNQSIAQKAKDKDVSKFTSEGALFCNRAKVMQKVKNVPMWGFVDKNHGMVIGYKYNEVENFKDGLAKVRKGHFWGLIDTTGKEVIPIAFDWVGDFEGDRAKVTTKGQKAYIDRSGKIVGRE